MLYLQRVLAACVAALMVSCTPVFAQNAKTYLHPRAIELLPMVVRETDTYFPDIPHRHYSMGLIEHESCISLKHSRCWLPTSRLKTAREEGLGLGQLTRTWHPDGRVRFDTLADMRRLYPQSLSELSWDTLRNRPDLQVRTMILMTRQSYKTLSGVKDPTERLKMADSAYNGGITNVIRSRAVCGLAKGCDPQRWYSNVERYNQKSTKILYDTRSPRDINNHHVRDVFETRMPKFEPLFKKVS